jgi:hypothetical protein
MAMEYDPKLNNNKQPKLQKWLERIWLENPSISKDEQNASWGSKKKPFQGPKAI